MDSNVISPELALVDPELAEAARLRLSAPRPPIVRVEPAIFQVTTASRRVRGRRLLWAAVLVVAAAALGYATAWQLVVRDGLFGDRARPAGTAVTPASLPSAAATAPARPGAEAVRLVWRQVTGASYYDLILWRGHRRVLDLWPAKPVASVPHSWQRAGQTTTLEPGRYTWFVYPGFGPRPAHRFGALAASGTFVVGTP